MDDDSNRSIDRLTIGVPGLDTVLNGGLVPGRNYLVRGTPGTGKTLLGVHFLTGARPDENALFINMGEPRDDVERDARAFGFDLDDVAFLDLSPSASQFVEDRTYDVFPTDHVESGPVTEEISDAVTSLDPDRVFVDPVTQFRYLTPDEHQFREHVLAFLQFLKEQAATVLFTSQSTASSPDDDLQFMSDGIVHLEYESGRRTLTVTKFRGSDFQSGTHAVRIRDDGMTVYPRLVPDDYTAEFSPEPISSGIPAVDSLLHGGIERGTATLLTGPSGVGKTTLGTQFVKEAASRGERSVLYTFEESRSTLLHRCDAIDVPVDDLLDDGTFAVEEVEALDRSVEEFAHAVRCEVEERDARVVMIDGLEGYRSSLTGSDSDLAPKLHALTRYLQNVGVTVILVSETGNVTGDFHITKDEVSYLADNVVFLRYLEFEGELRKAVGVLKKRASDFERTLREFEITDSGIAVGEPLSGLRGVLRGEPEWTNGDESQLGGD